MSDWPDRWVDSALQELHGSRPPDLSARIVVALQEAERGALPRLAEPRPAPSRRGVAARWVLASAALVLVGVGAGAWGAGALRPAPARVVRLDVAVHEGVLECVEVAADGVHRSRHAAGSRVAFAARAGDRLLAPAPCRFQVGPFGELATGPATELEVRQMSVSWQHGVVAASSLTIAVVAGVVTWHALDDRGTARAGEVVHLEAGERGGGDATASGAELDRLRREIEELRQRNADLQLQLAREPAPPVEPVVTEPPPPPVDPVTAEAVFVDDRYADLLAALDWKVMGEVTEAMGPLLVDLVEKMQETGEMPMELLAEIGALNSQLVAQVPALMKSGLPGSGPNGAYTHPLVAANILAKTLDAAGLSMDQGQRDRIAGLVRAFSVETQAVADSTQEFDLQRIAAEAETKDRFYREMSSLLTPEQFRVMFPEGANAYDGASLFHSSLFTRQFVDGVSAASPAEFARSVSNTYGERLGLDEQKSAQVRAIVERMSAAVPELWRDRAGPVESELHMLRAGRADAAMRHQIEIMREILRQVPMSPAQRKQFLAMKVLFVPLPK